MYKFLLGKKGEVAHLVTQTLHLKRLTRLLQRTLPPSLAPHFQVAALTGPRLLLTTDSATWAARLRMQAPDLITTIAKQLEEFQGVKYIEVKIIPARIEPESSKNTERRLSASASRDLRMMAESLENGELKQALLRLANRNKKTK